MDEEARTGARGSPWTRFEIEAVVAAYDEMLRRTRDPRLYVLDGSVEERASLEPKVFLGIPL